jgi:hypothetical protein
VTPCRRIFTDDTKKVPPPFPGQKRLRLRGGIFQKTVDITFAVTVTGTSNLILELLVMQVFSFAGKCSVIVLSVLP